MRKDVRQMIRDSKFKQYEIAYKIGISNSTLCVWVRPGQLTDEREKKIRGAISALESKNK